MKKENNLEWITLLKVVLCISIVFIHIVLGWRSIGVAPTSYHRVYFIDTIFSQPIIRFDAIPCFLMITGCLLLDPKKDIDLKKIKKYLIRIIEENKKVLNTNNRSVSYFWFCILFYRKCI